MNDILEQAVRKRFLEEQNEKKQREELIKKSISDYVNGKVTIDELPRESRSAINYALGMALGSGKISKPSKLW